MFCLVCFLCLLPNIACTSRLSILSCLSMFTNDAYCKNSTEELFTWPRFTEQLIIIVMLRRKQTKYMTDNANIPVDEVEF
jgi:hypothetical protein